MIAGHPVNAQCRLTTAQQTGCELPKISLREQHLGQDTARNVQQAQQVIVPLPAVVNEHQGSAGVVDIGDMPLTSRELPNQPTVDGAKSQLACLCLVPGSGHVVSNQRN